MTTPAEAPAPVMETVWLIEATYAPDAAETRVPFRAEHLARAAALKASGVIVEIGAFLDVSGTIVIIRAESEAAALDIVRADVYVANGIWVELRARPFGRLTDTTSG
jgi:uncharacterized protein YciI